MDRRNGSLREAMRQRQRAAGGGAAAGNPHARAYRVARQTGHLNLSSRDLAAFPLEILRLHELVDECVDDARAVAGGKQDEKRWECQPLQKLDLSYNEIARLPANINELRALTSFKMRHNKLRELPSTVWEINLLTSLDLSNNVLEGALSESLGTLTQLRELGLEGNNLTQLPDSICSLQGLEVLRVDSNQLKRLPDEIGNLRNLHSISAHSNHIEHLPESFGKLTLLSTIDLHKNRLTTTGSVFASLGAVKYIDLRQNQLEGFPTLSPANANLDQLFLGYNALHTIPEAAVVAVNDSLTVLEIRDNKLQTLPTNLALLYRLKTLDVTNNDLHDLPPGLGYLKYLNHFMVDGNPLRSIRRSIISSGTEALKKYLRTRGSPPKGVDVLEEEVDEFSTMSKPNVVADQVGAASTVSEMSADQDYIFRDAASSGVLQLAGKRLHTLPDHVRGDGVYSFSMTLQQLDLSKNPLGHLSKEVGELSSLHTLIAEECSLRSIHPSVAKLPRLQWLRLRKNMLTSAAVNTFLEISNGAGVAQQLQELDLRNNMLTALPSKLQYLVGLDTLLLSFNQIRTLEGFPWSSMPALSVLSLSNNRLEVLGTVYEARGLTSLSLENNELRQIPPELALCERLRALHLAGNPQRSIRLHIIDEGTEAVLKYLRNRLPVTPTPPTLETSRPNPTAFSHEDAENAPPSNQEPSHVAHEAYPKRLRSSTGTAVPSQQYQLFKAPANNDVHDVAPARSLGVPASAESVPGEPTGDVTLFVLDDQVANLERQLEDFGISSAKRYALKKELAMVRSKRIRHVRQMQQQS